MAEELHLPSDQVQEVPRSSMTIETTLSDGTTINLAVSPASTESSAVTASTTFTRTSFSLHISTSLPNQALSSRASSPSQKPQTSPISLPSEETPKPTSTQPPPVTYLKPSKMSTPITLPEDVVAIDTGKKSLMFYVYPDEDGKNILSYLESDDASAKGSFTLERISTVYNPFKKSAEAVRVSAKNKQVRVYYVDSKTNDIREVCKTGDRKWEVGSLSTQGENFPVRAGTSISASVHAADDGCEYELRVFAAPEGKVNTNRVPQISLLRYVVKKKSTATEWKANYITENITEY
ncbi:hypothetical protein FANTH_11975 [Fusarium anthophilum]|uniref:Fucose-specific lectin n=1 Tax=Fusarium anthophilum TaxID=48485 RepID=A0A8H5DTA2_9HYPO|nr:hypothetical protein FANTH_11975 [Fusarium anthophilum]